MSAPLVPIALAFAGGVALGLQVAPPGWLVGVGLWVAALVILATWRGHLAAASAGLLVLGGLAGWARVGLPDPLPAVVGLRPGAGAVEGIVSGDPELDGPRTRLPLLLQGVTTATGTAPARGQVLVHLYGGSDPAVRVAAGDRIRARVQVSAAAPFRNPGDGDPSLRGEPRLLVIGRPDGVERLPAGPLPWWLRVRLWIHRVVQRELPTASGALFEGLLVGERRQLPPGLLANFRAAGVFHILAISGFNVALVAGAVVLLLRLLRLPPRLAAGVALAALVGFVAVVGAQPSVLRATVMGSLVLVAQLLRRESAVWNSLAAALLVLLALEPRSLVDPSLQLSFAATFGILYLSPALLRVLGPRWPRPLAAAVAVSAGAQIAVTPVMLAGWGQLSLIGVVANLVVVPLAGVLTTLGFLAMLAALASDALAHLVFQTLWGLLLVLRWVVRGIAVLPGAVLYVPRSPPLALAAATAAVLLAPVATRAGRRLVLAGLVAAAVVPTALGYLPDGRLRVLVLDVGQGDAILVRGPDGRALLVDTGMGGPGRFDRGEHVVLPALRRAGIRRLAALALTHGDPDHTGGLVSVLEGIPVDEVWVPAGSEDADWQRPILAAGTARRALVRGDRIWLGSLLVTVLHPPPPDPSGGAERGFRGNNASLMLRVDWGLAGVVLTGDAEARAEREVLAAGLPLRAALLKVGHHGSRGGSSTEFVEAVGPRYALVSVGARNPFGHPSPAVLARLAEGGASIRRTDTDGALEAVSDGARLWIRHWARPTRVEELLLRGAP